MPRFVYNTQTPFGQILSGAIDKLIQGQAELTRVSSALDAMTDTECETEVGVPAGDYATVRNRINLIEKHIGDETYKRNLVLFDQG